MRETFFIFFMSCVFLTSCSNKNKPQKIYWNDSGTIFHTQYNIKYEYSNSLTKEIENELLLFDSSLNPFKKTSIISKVNNNEEVELDSFFIEVFNKSQEVSKISGGDFDITCSPLINAWGFGFKNMDSVTPQQIDSLREFVGYNKIHLINNKIIKDDPRIQINTSAIAKGFSVDVVCRMLDSIGVENYMCEIGGEVRAKGVNQHNECWRIGIDKPIDEKIPTQRQLQTVIQLCDKAIATSGSYRNFHEKDGKKYSHTIDPKTGYPSGNNILSASVVADDCMTADAYATVFMLASIEEMHRIAKEQNLEVFIIYSEKDGSIATAQTESFSKYTVSQKQ